jgi:hypothetical protein
MESLDLLLTYAREELKRNGLLETDLGNSILELLKQIHIASYGNTLHMENMVVMVTRLINRLPLSTIDKEEVCHKRVSAHGEIVVGTPRYEFLIQEADGKYYDMHATAFVNSAGQKYYISKSKKEVVDFPYYPVEKVEYDDENC